MNTFKMGFAAAAAAVLAFGVAACGQTTTVEEPTAEPAVEAPAEPAADPAAAPADPAAVDPAAAPAAPATP